VAAAAIATAAAAGSAAAVETLTAPGMPRDVVSDAPLAAPVERPLPLLGVMVDAGIPDGATGSLVVRPFSWLRAEVGGGYNLISKSVRGGLALIPFGSGPSATLEAGRYFEGDANGLARRFAGAGYEDNAALQRVGYDFVNAHLGLDFGQRWFTFFIHGGMSYVRAQIHNVDTVISEGTSGSTTVSFKQDPVIRAFTPSVKLGFVIYFW